MKYWDSFGLGSWGKDPSGSLTFPLTKGNATSGLEGSPKQRPAWPVPHLQQCRAYDP